MNCLFRRLGLARTLFLLLATSCGHLLAQDSAIDRKITPGDTLVITVVDEPGLDRLPKKVDSEGKITFPFLGELIVKGKSTAEIEKLIQSELDRDWIINPQVSVGINDYVKKFVNVTGQVGKPGPVELPVDRKLRLADAVSAAGDVTRLGNRKKIQLSRKGVTKTYNLDDLMKISDPSEQVYVEPDDDIKVPMGVL